jgi:hypothetical protein
MAFLGLISYGLYLWHVTVIHLVLDYTGWILFHTPPVPFMITVFGATVLVSSVTYVLVERPCMALGRRWARRLREGRRREGGAGFPRLLPGSVPSPAHLTAIRRARCGGTHVRPAWTAPGGAAVVGDGGPRDARRTAGAAGRVGGGRGASGGRLHPARHTLPLTTPDTDP